MGKLLSRDYSSWLWEHLRFWFLSKKFKYKHRKSDYIHTVVMSKANFHPPQLFCLYSLVPFSFSFIPWFSNLTWYHAKASKSKKIFLVVLHRLILPLILFLSYYSVTECTQTYPGHLLSATTVLNCEDTLSWLKPEVLVLKWLTFLVGNTDNMQINFYVLR